MTITAAQCKMARAALGWRIEDLRARSEVAVSTIFRFENGQRQPIPATLAALERAFESAGIEFFEDGGVRLKRELENND